MGVLSSPMSVIMVSGPALRFLPGRTRRRGIKPGPSCTPRVRGSMNPSLPMMCLNGDATNPVRAGVLKDEAENFFLQKGLPGRKSAATPRNPVGSSAMTGNARNEIPDAFLPASSAPSFHTLKLSHQGARMQEKRRMRQPEISIPKRLLMKRG